ncbi:lysine--tRNA ligase [Sorangium sp. So ce136]|uniref:lysine--tRNA ligase n=1 Tax=Sorangium sp. So ce136 TaxID=3133284 RepID=UPI003F09D84C
MSQQKDRPNDRKAERLVKDAAEAARAEETLIATRKAKAARLRDRGENPFANDVTAGEPLTELAAVRARFDGARAAAEPKAEGAAPDRPAPPAADRYDPARVEPLPFRVAGRVLFVRSFGGVTFVRLRDRTGELQLYCEQGSLADFERLEDVDLGDFVEAHGVAMATQKGELSIRAERLRLLTKAYRPLPTKTSFKDVESRYRMRYVDLVANPHVAGVFRARSAIVAALRDFLDARGFLEVETPTMHTLVGGATAKPFKTHHNALDLELFLRIAPELFLKRLVVGGFERVYEIGRCYRNEGLSTRHNPEFTMIEYYQAYATYETLMDATEAMLRHVDARLAERLPAEHAAWAAQRTYSLERFARVPMAEGIARALSKSGLPADVPQRITADDAPIKEWAKAAKASGREIDWTNFRAGAKKCESPGELVFSAYEYVVEPFLTRDYRTEAGDKSIPVFIIDYPFEVSPLARKKDSDPALVDRFELFIDGRELCNAFSELNDPEDQDARFRAQVAKKSRGEEETMDYDADYVRALEHGLPPTAGFGMGIDRLTMLLTGATSIRDVILFPLLRPETDT